MVDTLTLGMSAHRHSSGAPHIALSASQVK